MHKATCILYSAYKDIGMSFTALLWTRIKIAKLRSLFSGDDLWLRFHFIIMARYHRCIIIDCVFNALISLLLYSCCTATREKCPEWVPTWTPKSEEEGAIHGPATWSLLSKEWRMKLGGNWTDRGKESERQMNILLPGGALGAMITYLGTWDEGRWWWWWWWGPFSEHNNMYLR